MIPVEVDKWREVVQIHRGPLDADLILAVIWQESSGDQWAYRYEPQYQYFVDVKSGKPLHRSHLSGAANRLEALRLLGSTEFNAQSASYGLMQVMGAVAREHDMHGWLTALCDPNVGIKFGCKHLIGHYKRNGDDIDTALLRYNGGHEYPNKIAEKLRTIKGR